MNVDNSHSAFCKQRGHQIMFAYCFSRWTIQRVIG